MNIYHWVLILLIALFQSASFSVQIKDKVSRNIILTGCGITCLYITLIILSAYKN